MRSHVGCIVSFEIFEKKFSGMDWFFIECC
jgi:hypothetical protein